MKDIIFSIMPGLAEMANIHPMVVHFPIALLNAFVLMELLGLLMKKEELRVAATWMLYLGTAGAVVTVLAGFQAASTVPHDEVIHNIMLQHRNFGVAVLLLSVSLSIWRAVIRGQFLFEVHLLFIGLAFMMTGLMAFGADRGGLMVYKYGVAVKAVPEPLGHDHNSGHGEEVMSHHGMAVENDDGMDGHHDDGGGEENSHDMPHDH